MNNRALRVRRKLARSIRLALRSAITTVLALSASSQIGGAQDGCRVEAVDYKGWQAQQISNRWVQLIVVPQNGGRLIQVTFAGHPYLFVNPKLAGKYYPPSSKEWFNYGGDKLWLLPEGNNDEQHWVGNSDVLDDGPFTFRKLSEGKKCEIELTGPSDPQTGIQFTRTISIGADSPRIAFHWSMKNITGHTLEWSMQSVSQYDTSVPDASGSLQQQMNHDFWTFTPANRSSAYLNRYHVRYGPAENPAVHVRDDDFFTVHYVHMAAELWLDSTEGWLAVVDGNSKYAMVERFAYDRTKEYPGKASVIFWTNGGGMHLNGDGNPAMSGDADAGPFYLEAEINSPMCRLRPDESCAFDTEWFPTRSGAEFHGVSDAGILIRPLTATAKPDGKVSLLGTFGVFYAGRLVAHPYTEHGRPMPLVQISQASPNDEVTISTDLSTPEKCSRVSIHLIDDSGVDRGALQEVHVSGQDIH